MFGGSGGLELFAGSSPPRFSYPPLILYEISRSPYLRVGGHAVRIIPLMRGLALGERLWFTLLWWGAGACWADHHVNAGA